MGVQKKEEDGGWASYTLTLTQQNLIGHLNRVIFNCLTAAASVPRHSPYLSLSPFSFTSLLTPSLLLLPSLLTLLSIPPPTSVCPYFPFSRHTHSLASSNTAPLSLFHNKLLEQGESVLQSLSSPVFLFRFYTFLLHPLLIVPVITTSPPFQLFSSSDR